MTETVSKVLAPIDSLKVIFNFKELTSDENVFSQEIVLETVKPKDEVGCGFLSQTYKYGVEEQEGTREKQMRGNNYLLKRTSVYSPTNSSEELNKELVNSLYSEAIKTVLSEVIKLKKLFRPTFEFGPVYDVPQGLQRYLLNRSYYSLTAVNNVQELSAAIFTCANAAIESTYYDFAIKHYCGEDSKIKVVVMVDPAIAVILNEQLNYHDNINTKFSQLAICAIYDVNFAGRAIVTLTTVNEGDHVLNNFGTFIYKDKIEIINDARNAKDMASLQYNFIINSAIACEIVVKDSVKITSL